MAGDLLTPPETGGMRRREPTCCGEWASGNNRCGDCPDRPKEPEPTEIPTHDEVVDSLHEELKLHAQEVGADEARQMQVVLGFVATLSPEHHEAFWDYVVDSFSADSLKGMRYLPRVATDE